MSIIYKDYTFGDLRSYLSREQSGVVPASYSAAPLYAHPMDGMIIRALDAMPVKTVLQPITNNLTAFQSASVLVNGIVISPKSFTEIWKLVSHCAHVLGIAPPMTVAIGGSELNAYTSGTDDKAFICVSSTLLQLFSFEEACFVIGHECGHIHCHHVMYHMLYRYMGSAAGALGPLGRLISSTAGVTLSAWSRRSEISSDRAGLICCGDLKVAESALLRLITGFADLDAVNVEDYLEQIKAMEIYLPPGFPLRRIFADQPSIPRRILALRLFAESSLYYELSGKERPLDKALLSREELNQRVSALIQ